ncbi:hypothetical protein BGZ65_002931, partial [Modicella reniformis]
MKHSVLILLATLVGTVSILNTNNNAAEAAPISRILSSHQPVLAQVLAPARAQAPSSGNPQIKSRSHRHRHQSRASSSLNIRTKQLSELERLLSSLPNDGIVPIPAAASESLPWLQRTGRSAFRRASFMHGHAVLDERDDDAGNEMLDTEADGSSRPDD